MSIRVEKISSLIRSELSLIMLQKINDPEVRLVTITNVKVTPDLKEARIYISIYNKEKRAAIFEKINALKSFFRGEIGHRIKLRYTPELIFFLDDTLDYVEKMEGLFKQIHDDDRQEEN